MVILRQRLYTVSYTHLDVYKRQGFVFPVVAFTLFAVGLLYGLHSNAHKSVSYTHLDVYKRQEYGEILIYQTDDGQTNIEVKIEDDTVWLTQQQLTELYQCSKSNISEQ